MLLPITSRKPNNLSFVIFLSFIFSSVALAHGPPPSGCPDRLSPVMTSALLKHERGDQTKKYSIGTAKNAMSIVRIHADMDDKVELTVIWHFPAFERDRTMWVSAKNAVFSMNGCMQIPSGSSTIKKTAIFTPERFGEMYDRGLSTESNNAIFRLFWKNP